MDGDEKRPMTVREAGRKGGEKVAAERGREFFKDIGHKGGTIGGQRVKELIARAKKLAEH